MLRNASIGKKLFYAFFALAIMSSFIGYLGSLNIQRNNKVFEEIISGSTPRIQALLEMKNVSNEIGHNATLIQTTNAGADEAGGSSASDSKSLILADLERLLHWIDQYQNSLSENSDSMRDAFLVAVNESKSLIIASTLDYIDARELGNSMEVVVMKEKTLNTHINALKELIASAINTEVKDLRLQKENAERGMKKTLTSTVVLSVLSVCIAVLAWALLSKLIVRPLRSLRNATQAVAGGNLEHVIDIDSTDEIGDLAKAFKNMIERLLESREVLTASNDELENAQKELEKKLNETNMMNKHMIDRELKMIELKKEITSLRQTIEKTILNTDTTKRTRSEQPEK